MRRKSTCLSERARAARWWHGHLLGAVLGAVLGGHESGDGHVVEVERMPLDTIDRVVDECLSEGEMKQTI